MVEVSRIAPKRQIHSKHEHRTDFNIIHFGEAKLQEFREVMIDVGVDPASIPPIGPEGETIVVRQSDGKIFPYDERYGEPNVRI